MPTVGLEAEGGEVKTGLQCYKMFTMASESVFAFL